MNWSLPTYKSLSETMTASLARTSESKSNPFDNKTETRMSYNVALKAATRSGIRHRKGIHSDSDPGIRIWGDVRL